MRRFGRSPLGLITAVLFFQILLAPALCVAGLFEAAPTASTCAGQAAPRHLPLPEELTHDDLCAAFDNLPDVPLLTFTAERPPLLTLVFTPWEPSYGLPQPVGMRGPPFNSTGPPLFS